MKSTLNKFRQYEHNPIETVLEKMHLEDTELFHLMQMWIKQNYISKTHPQYITLKAIIQNKKQLALFEQQKMQLDEFQVLLNEGLSPKSALEKMGLNDTNVNHFYKKWYRILIKQNYSLSSIASELQINKNQISKLTKEYEDEQILKIELKKQKIKQNKLKAESLLNKIYIDYKNKGNQYLIYDIEAKQNPDEPIEFSIINLYGDILFDKLIKPQNPIDKHIQKLTGITNEMVKDKPDIYHVIPALKEIVKGKTLLSWGSDYDIVVINKTCARTGIDLECQFECAQHLHMGLCETLEQSALYQAADCPSQTHRALDDCMLVLKILKHDMPKT